MQIRMRALTMLDFLRAVEEHGTSAGSVLRQRGYHAKIVWRKSEKAWSKGYTECGVSADCPWLTEEGRVFLQSRAAERNESLNG